MGASGWAYFVPYQADIYRALQELRASVFESGEYFSEVKLLSATIERMQGRMPAGTLQRFQDRLTQLQDQPQPENIEELMDMTGESGTHSILDIDGISEIPEFGKVTALSRQRLQQFFGTERPTRAMVEAQIGKIQDSCKRWEGLYLIVFENDLPKEICFVGVSGD